MHTAQEIIHTADAIAAKCISHKLMFHPNLSRWNKEKESLMAELLLAKAHQVPIFRQTLLNTGHRRIEHPVINRLNITGDLVFLKSLGLLGFVSCWNFNSHLL